MDDETRSVAIVGAGMAGLTCAQELARAGWRVQIFDKGRGPGGRMSTRRAEVNGQDLRFDHGAQYFTVRDPGFRAQIERWKAEGVVARWPAAGEDAWVGTPAMNALIKAMAEALGVEWGTRIEKILKDGSRYHLQTETKTFVFKQIVCAAPAEQASVLLQEAAPELAAAASAVESEPCWAVMASFACKLDLPDCLRDEAGPIRWAARNSSKPGRIGSETWVIHASPSRTKELLDRPRDDVGAQLLGDFFRQTQIAPVEPIHLASHRWLYAMPQSNGVKPLVWDEDLRVGICGDYLHSPRVEGAFLSGRDLAQQMLC